ncbi:hypothetical protein ACFWZT_39955 [Streptomyces alboflavus]|uniref:hypothetical protein n=1 Tax=Streptomyces alboflavus TaxID=67267 RepID=UPI00369C8882
MRREAAPREPREPREAGAARRGGPARAARPRQAEAGPRTRPSVPRLRVSRPGPRGSRPNLRALATLPLLMLTVLAVGCAPSGEDAPGLTPGDTIKAAQQQLTDTCLTRKGLTPPRPGDRPPSAAEQQRVARALFGTGRTELALTLPTGHAVRAHTDGCLASAQRTLYGDQRRWFRVSTVVNNLKPEAAFREEPLTEVRDRHRSDLAEWRRLRTRALINAKAHLQSESRRAAAR